MTRAIDLLTLVQWLSPAFPVGAYAYSQGLEHAISDGRVTDPASLSEWIRGVLSHGAGRMDAILLVHGRREDGLADLAYAYTTSAERCAEMRDQGAAFGQLVQGLTGQIQPPLPYALAVAQASRSLSLEDAEVAALFLQALAAQLVSAAVRFVPLGAAEGQKVLSGLSPLITDLAARCAQEPLSALASATLGADHAAMRHETLDVRIFRS
ncbi:urease accessory protein UreF [bacterium]|nr:urease accessory protein UreF [bacterium]